DLQARRRGSRGAFVGRTALPALALPCKERHVGKACATPPRHAGSKKDFGIRCPLGPFPARLTTVGACLGRISSLVQNGFGPCLLALFPARTCSVAQGDRPGPSGAG